MIPLVKLTTKINRSNREIKDKNALLIENFFMLHRNDIESKRNGYVVFDLKLLKSIINELYITMVENCIFK